MAKTWTLAEQRTEFRDLTGRPETTDISDANVNNLLNDYWQNYFPIDSDCAQFHGDWTQELSATDDGDYDIASTVLELRAPFTIDGDKIKVYTNKDKFFSDYPDNFEQFITSPALAIGSTSAAAIANSAFKYDISGYRYSKDAAETALSGDTIPQNKYGAFCLKINSSKTITVYEADDNATGYDSITKAIDGLPDEDSDSCYMGYVVVINTSGTFIPGTTLLSASGVTDTYTNGVPSQRNKPLSVLIEDDKVYVRPKANDYFLLKSASIDKPDAMSGDSSVLPDIMWGSVIPIGAAMLFLTSIGQVDKAKELQSIFDYKMNFIRGKRTAQIHQGGVERAW